MKSNYNVFPVLLIIILVVTLIGIFKIKNFRGYEYIILLIPALNFLVDLLSNIMVLFNENTNVYYNILTLTEMLLSLIVYYQYLSGKRIKQILVITMITFMAFSILNFIFMQDIFKSFATFNFFAGGMLISFFSYLVWRNDIRKDRISPNNLILWFAGANFIYYTSTIPILSTNNWLLEYSKSMAFPIYTINKVMYAIWAIILGMGFLWKRQATI